VRTATIALALTSIAIFGCKSEEDERQERLEKAAAEVAKAAEAAGAEADEAGNAFAKLANAAGRAAAEATGEASEKTGDAAKDFNKAMEGFAKAMGGGEKVEPVSFRELKALLPEELADLKRTKSSGEKAGAMGVKVSHAMAKYGDGDERIEVKITDTGGMRGIMKMAATAWATTEFERESDDGFERTTTIEGHKAVEKFHEARKKTEIQAIVADRFHVELKARGLSFKDAKSAVGDLDLDKLAKLAPSK